MPTQWELETEGRLGGIDSKLDAVLNGIERVTGKHDIIERRVGSLESFRSRVYGVATGLMTVGTAIGAITWILSRVVK